MKSHSRAIVIVILAVGVLTFVVVSRALQSGQSTNPGRLVFTDIRPSSGFTVALFDLEHNLRTSLSSMPYQDIGELSPIDSTHVYVSACFAMNNPIFCTAFVRDILSPEQVKRFDPVKHVWKENYGPPVWSPDGTHIAFTVIKGGTKDHPEYYGETFVMNADGTNILDLTPGEDNNGGNFTWSPDSQQIAFACHDERSLCIASVDGNLLRQINVIPNTKVRDLAWSPLRTQIVFALVPDKLYSSELYIIDADGSNLRGLSAAGANYHQQPIWSPDGSKIAFRSGEQGNNIGEIYVINSNGENLHNLSQSLNGNEFGHTWSPDSTSIAFFSDQDQAGMFLYITHVDGTGLRRITDNHTWDQTDVWPPIVFWLP